MIYNLRYDDDDLARVEIYHDDTSRTAIKEMVEFWSGWESKVEEAKGDYTTVWLTMLARHLILNGGSPGGEEGWYPLDGTRHIWVRGFWPWDPNPNLIQIEEEST